MGLLTGEIQARMWQQRQNDERSARLERIKTAWQYYNGEHPAPLAVRPNAPDDNVIVNLARPVVDKGISLLFGKEVEWQVDESASTTTPVEQFLSDVWVANDKMVLLTELAQNGALAGVAAIKIVPRPGDVQRPYRLVNLDPANLEIQCDDEDVDEVERYRIEYTTCDDKGQEIVKRQDIAAVENEATGVVYQWTIQDFVARGAMKTFEPVGEPIAWPYALPPIVHCKNLPMANCVWGVGDLEDVRLNDAINLIASSTRKILRLHGSPQTVAYNFDPAMLRRDANQIWHVPEGTDGRLENLEMQSDLASSLAFYRDLRAAFYAQGRMPDVSQIGNLGALTNFGLRVLFADALERTATKRLLYGGLIQRINRTLALIAGKGDNVTVSLTWPDPLPVNGKELVETITAEQATGLVSEETLTGKLGYDFADEQARLDDERAARQARAPGVGATGPRAAPADMLPTEGEPDESMRRMMGR